jgi:hypothetical protein
LPDRWEEKLEMANAGLVLLGAALTFLATLFVERWKLIRASQAAALMIARELESHQLRLGQVVWADERDFSYEFRFPSPAWSAYSTALLAGAPLHHAEAVLEWYAAMAVLGGMLSRQATPEGSEMTGPPRTRLREALDEAYEAAQRLAARRVLRRPTVQRRSPLFEQPAGDHEPN